MTIGGLPLSPLSILSPLSLLSSFSLFPCTAGGLLFAIASAGVSFAVEVSNFPRLLTRTIAATTATSAAVPPKTARFRRCHHEARFLSFLCFLGRGTSVSVFASGTGEVSNACSVAGADATGATTTASTISKTGSLAVVRVCGYSASAASFALW